MKENQITYTNVNGINYPNLKLFEQSDISISKDGMILNNNELRYINTYMVK